jgi:tRNA pseudouridine38-40 synthase
MRYFLTLAYKGTQYCGWQRQPNAPSVQEVLEKALTTLLRQPIAVTGCGRTDTGVHARYYIAHFDTADDTPLPPHFLIGVNGLLPFDIGVFSGTPMPAHAHARFDAFERRYCYTIGLRKDPFEQETAWFYPPAQRFDRDAMQAVADLLLRYEAFYPFCKRHSGVDHYNCTLYEARWDFNGSPFHYNFHIRANRFLRGMVRLIVGACVLAGRGKLALSDVETALDNQTTIPGVLSVPPQGLALTDIRYPYEIGSTG